MFCNSCGSKLKKDDRVCSACGAPADQGETCGGFWGIVTAAPPAAAGGIKQPGTGIKQPVNAAPAIKEQPRHTAPAPAPAPAAAPVHTPAPVPVAAPAPKRPPVLLYGLAALLALLLVIQLVWTGVLHARLNRLADEVEQLREQVEVTEPRENIVPETTIPETTVPATTVPATTEPTDGEDSQDEKEAVKSEESRPGKSESTEGETQPSGGNQTTGDTQPSGEDQTVQDTQPAEKPQDEPPAETTN